MILEAQADDLGERRGRDVQDGYGVVFLQCHPGGSGVARNGDVFRFQILRETCVWPEGANAGGVFLRNWDSESGGPNVILCQAGDVPAHVDDAHRAFGIDGIRLVITIRFTFVGDEQPAAVRRKSDHIR